MNGPSYRVGAVQRGHQYHLGREKYAKYEYLELVSDYIINTSIQAIIDNHYSFFPDPAYRAAALGMVTRKSARLKEIGLWSDQFEKKIELRAEAVYPDKDIKKDVRFRFANTYFDDDGR